MSKLQTREYRLRLDVCQWSDLKVALAGYAGRLRALEQERRGEWLGNEAAIYEGLLKELLEQERWYKCQHEWERDDERAVE